MVRNFHNGQWQNIMYGKPLDLDEEVMEKPLENSPVHSLIGAYLIHRLEGKI